MNEEGWFADIDDENAHVSRYRWRPFLQLRGHVLRLDIWFASQEDCERFLRDEVLRKEMI